ncbi:hypothetical protein J8137_01650 [Lactiplantibacillus plantarum]|nr:hypothetical protein [Lactiplantibacillus plantarum]
MYVFSWKKYYLHLFAPGQPDLNLKNSEVRQAVFDIECFWLDKGVDGFKTDFINLISKPVSYQAFQEEHPSQERIKAFINEEVRNKNHWAKSAIQMYQILALNNTKLLITSCYLSKE